MDPALASIQARLATFAVTATGKPRRTSSKSKKAAPKTKASWPLSSPSAQDLAFAGFVWRPTSASQDNVQCFNCNCQLDGWEESDVPAFEHLTHSPRCGYANVICIRLRDGDPGRTEEDPMSEAMLAARRDTFGDVWPLDVSAGFPSPDQLAAAGWYYDPSTEPDGVTCPYCSLSLDAWDAGDDPMEEHRRRSEDCLFFALSELYNQPPPPKKGKRASTSSTKGKRASARSSTASTISKKGTRGKQRASDATEQTDISEVIQSAPPKKATRGKKRGSEAIEETEISELVQSGPTTKKATRGKKRTSTATEEPDFSEVIQPAPTTKKATRGKKRTSTATEEPDFSEVIQSAPTNKKATRGKKRASEAIEEPEFSEPVQYAPSPKKATRGKKRSSEVIEETEYSEIVQPMPKRLRSLSIESFPDDLPVGTPKKTPIQETKDVRGSSVSMSSLPADLLVGTPKKTPTTDMKDVDMLDNETSSFPADPEVESLPAEPDFESLPAEPDVATPKKTPTRSVEGEDGRVAYGWQPADIDALFASQGDAQGFMNDILIDAGLDKIDTDGATKEDLYNAVMAGLTDAEKNMTIEQWVLYNAKRGEEKLRIACEKQIMAFEAEGTRAMAVLEAIPTI